MKKITYILCCFLTISACSSATAKITTESYLEYKNLYCNTFVGTSRDIGILDRSSETIVTEKNIPTYQKYAAELKKINVPKKYTEEIHSILELLNKKETLSEEYKAALNNFDVKYPHVSFFLPCDEVEGECIDANNTHIDYYRSLFDPILKKRRLYNSKILFNHDKIFLMAKEDLEIYDQQFICGDTERQIRKIFEEQ